jgi:hypothetical protein
MTLRQLHSIVYPMVHLGTATVGRKFHRGPHWRLPFPRRKFPSRARTIARPPHLLEIRDRTGTVAPRGRLHVCVVAVLHIARCRAASAARRRGPPARARHPSRARALRDDSGALSPEDAARGDRPGGLDQLGCLGAGGAEVLGHLRVPLRRGLRRAPAPPRGRADAGPPDLPQAAGHTRRLRPGRGGRLRLQHPVRLRLLGRGAAGRVGRSSWEPFRTAGETFCPT